MRGLTFLLLFFSIFAAAETTLKPTDIVSSPIDDIGAKRSTRPTQKVENESLQSEIRPLSDGLNFIPGIQARLNGSPTVSIRGSQSSSRTLVLVDGAPLNFGDGLGYNPLFVPVENIDHMTLLRGSSSALFGHDAISGALEFTSQNLGSAKAFESFGSFNTTQTFAGAPFEIGGAKAQATVYQSHSDGNYPYSTQNGYSGTRTRNDQETVRAAIKAEGQSTESLRWKTAQIFSRQIGSTPGALNFPSANAFNNWSTLSYLGMTYNFSENDKLGSRTSYTYLHQYYPQSPQPLTTSDTQGFRQGLSYSKTLGDHQVEIFDDLSMEFLGSSYLSQTTDTLNEYGVSDLISLGASVTAQPAVRLSNENGGLIPSLGIDWMVNSTTKTFAQYSTGFRPPSISQRYSQSPFFVGNSTLLPESSTEIDLGAETLVFESVTLHIEGFERDIYSMITNVTLPSFVLTSQNVGHARAWGGEVALGNSDYGISASYLNNVLLDTDTPVPLSPRFQGSAHASKKVDSWTFTIQDTYWSDYYDASATGLVNLNSWNTTDLFVSNRINNNLEIKAAALNIFNQARQLTLYYPEPQASYSLTLTGYL